MRAPVLGGNFGVWGGLFSTFDCAVKGIRKKEDPYNAIIAGFFTGGALAIRGGYKPARNNAIGCAVLLAVIEGVGIGFQKMMAGSTKLEVGRGPPGGGRDGLLFSQLGFGASGPAHKLTLYRILYRPQRARERWLKGRRTPK